MLYEVITGVGHGGVGEARERDDVARFGAVHRHPLEAAEGEDLAGARLLDEVAVTVQRLDP